MNYKKILPILGLAVCTVAFGAPKEHDNNIIYKDGQPMQIQSTQGVDVELASKAGTDPDFVILKNGQEIFRASAEGIDVREQALTNIIDEVVSAKLDELKELLAFVKAFRYDYTAFKVLEDARFNMVYEDIGHTSLTTLTTNNAVVWAFSTPGASNERGMRSLLLENETGYLGSSDLGALWKLKLGTDPAVVGNWVRVSNTTFNAAIRGSSGGNPGADEQKIYRNYVRSIAYNKFNQRWYFLTAGKSIWSSNGSDTDFVRETVDGKTEVNCYHLAIGADGTMIATTEFGPAYKKLVDGEYGSNWVLIDTTTFNVTTYGPIRAVCAGNTVVADPVEVREVKLTRDLGAGNDLLPGTKSRFVIGSTAGYGIWYSDGEDVTAEHWTKIADTDPAIHGSFRQIAYHNGTFVAPNHYTTEFTRANPDILKNSSIFYSTDGIHWTVSPDTPDIKNGNNQPMNWYEPQFALGMFIVPAPWNTGKIAVNPDPTNGGKWTLIEGNGFGYGAKKNSYGVFTHGPYGFYKVKASAIFYSPLVQPKAFGLTREEVSEMIREAIQSSREASNSLQ